jgi:hypothetical protein
MTETGTAYNIQNPSNLVVTVAVIMHGQTTNLDLKPEVATLFDNSRLYQLSGKFAKARQVALMFTRTIPYLRDSFRRDLTGETTYDLIQEYMDQTNDRYKQIEVDAGDVPAEGMGTLYEPITFDKVLRTYSSTLIKDYGNEGEIPDSKDDNITNIHVISVHEKTNNGLRLVYPLPQHANQRVNLLFLKDIADLGMYFGKSELARHVVNQFQREGIQTNIRKLRMSTIMKILKYILGTGIYTNIFDYSCSVLSLDMSEKEKNFAQYMKEGDIETGAMRSYGGRRRSRKTKRHRVKKRKTSRTRKAGMQRPINEEHSPERTATNTSGTSYDYEANIESRDDDDSVSQLNLSNLNIDDSRDSESSRYSIASMSSMGDWEVEDYEDLNKILDKIDHFINFPDREPYYDTIILNRDINKLPVYDLHGRIQWLLNKLDSESEIYRTMDTSGYKRYMEVVNTLKSIQSEVPNTRTPTPANEIDFGATGIRLDEKALFKRISSNDSFQRQLKKGGRRKTRRRRSRKLKKRRNRKKSVRKRH